MRFVQSSARLLKIPLVLPPKVRLDNWKLTTRNLHNDFKYPDFTSDRTASTRDPESNSKKSVGIRRLTKTLPLAAGLIAGIYGGKAVTVQHVLSMAPSADVLAMAQIEVKIGSIPEGTMMTVKWRGKPLFVKHRTQEEIQIARETPLSVLKDPQRDEDRVVDPKWLIMVGICTHLGCVPIGNAGDYNSYYCPCHGSHYDQSGRIRKGPAPTNMEVPPYKFLDDNTIIVG